MEKKNCLHIFFTRISTVTIRITLLSIFFMISQGKTFAAGLDQNFDSSFSIANYLPIGDKTVSDGDIVSYSPSGYFLSKAPYDGLIVGIVTTNPAVDFTINGAKKTYPVVSTGNTYVNVTTSNGNIKKGDAITSSTTPGKGVKATKSGYIIGTAIENYASANTHAIKKLAVNLNVNYFANQTSVSNSIFDIFNLSTLGAYQEPIQAFKYFVAAVIVLVSFVFCFFSFARTASKGLEALGRNPLAGRTIQLGILLNIIVAVIIVLSGLLVAFFVIRL